MTNRHSGCSISTKFANVTSVNVDVSLIPRFCIEDGFWINFPTDNAHISPRSVTSSNTLAITPNFRRLQPALFSVSRYQKHFQECWGSLCHFLKWGIKIPLFSLKPSIQCNKVRLSVWKRAVAASEGTTPPDSAAPNPALPRSRAQRRSH